MLYPLSYGRKLLCNEVKHYTRPLLKDKTPGGRELVDKQLPLYNPSTAFAIMK